VVCFFCTTAFWIAVGAVLFGAELGITLLLVWLSTAPSPDPTDRYAPKHEQL
jgi:hypothetical protein